jgi:hypothetical protein
VLDDRAFGDDSGDDAAVILQNLGQLTQHGGL